MGSSELRRLTSVVPRSRAVDLRVGVSACLLGDEVRYDGGHKRHDGVVEKLGPLVSFVPVCPEVELGLSVPRQPINLTVREGQVRLVTTATGMDHTAAMAELSARRLTDLAAYDLDGFVLKSRSPSCGLEVPIIDGRTGTIRDRARGAFAAALATAFPMLPVVEESDLVDDEAIANFVSQLRARRQRGSATR